ncbi:MAG: HAMP domain-containing histidine kinase [Chloroflexi bacterium]|nr:HAMP domain-containing histidine kinase [Chloroflexota bacterium]
MNMQTIIHLLQKYGMQSNATTEYWWVIGRFLIIPMVAVGSLLEFAESFTLLPLAALLTYVALYNIVMLLQLRHKNGWQSVFAWGILLDSLTLLVGWAIAAAALPGDQVTNVLSLMLFPITIGGMARLGWRLGIAYTGFWVAWLVWSTYFFMGPHGQSFAELPMRLVFLLASTGLTALLVRTLTAERERAVANEHQLVQRRDEFISVAAHELRSPLTAILGFGELLQADPLTEVQRRRALTYIYQEGNRMNTLIQDLLDVSRIHAGKVPLRIEPVDIRATISQVVEPYRSRHSAHAFNQSVAPEVDMVMADRGKLQQVLGNLVDNAVKYSPNGGAISIAARLASDSPDVIVSVSDQGIGMKPEEMSTLFNYFSRTKTGEDSGIKGTGLGLYIVRSFMEMMGGQITVSSEKGKGATFTFTLPAQTRSSASALPFSLGRTSPANLSPSPMLR